MSSGDWLAGPDPLLPAGLLQSSRTASHRFSCLASTKRPFVISRTRPQVVVHECRRSGRLVTAKPMPSMSPAEQSVAQNPWTNGAVCSVARSEAHSKSAWRPTVCSSSSRLHFCNSRSSTQTFGEEAAGLAARKDLAGTEMAVKWPPFLGQVRPTRSAASTCGPVSYTHLDVYKRQG